MIEVLFGQFVPLADGREEGLRRGYVLVAGFGYGVSVPGYHVAAKRSDGFEDLWWIHEHPTGDLVELYGFASEVERSTFRALLKADRVGPKSAMRALSRFGVADLEELARTGDASGLIELKGFGEVGARESVRQLRKHFKIA